MTLPSAESVRAPSCATLYVPCKREERALRLEAASQRLASLHVQSEVAVVVEDESECIDFLRACVDENIVSGCEYLEVIHAGCSACLTYHIGDDLDRRLAELSSCRRGASVEVPLAAR